jgi:hypothetical protein
MCPLCEECTLWHLSDICTTSKLNRLFDNVFTVVFSFITNIWCNYNFSIEHFCNQVVNHSFILLEAIFFLEFWKRHSKKLAYLWNVLDYERNEVEDF